MFRTEVPPTLLIGYDRRIEELLKGFFESFPKYSDRVLNLHFKPKIDEVLNIKVMSPFPRIPVPHILDVLDPFNVEALKDFKVAIIASDDEVTIGTGLLLKKLGVETYFFEGDESIEIEKVADKIPEGERSPREINGYYVIPGYAKKVTSTKVFDEGYITETGCIVAISREAAERILREQSI